MPLQIAVPESQAAGTGARLVSLDGRPLPLRSVTIAADAGGGLARVRLEQRFVNPYGEPLRVTYQVPLPVDGALSGYEIRIGDRRIVGEVDRVASARERFEEALVEGRTASIVEQDRANVFTQELGNVPPGAEVIAELRVDQRLSWLREGAWEWRFPTVVAPRYLGTDGRVADADRVIVDVADGPAGIAASASITLRDHLVDGRQPESPSHALVTTEASDGHEVTLAADGEGHGLALDRDLVVRWPVAGAQLAPSLRIARPGDGPRADSAYGLLTVVPPASGYSTPVLPRDLIVLLDTSGSMSGAPLDQAQRAVAALIESLGDADRLELIEYSNAPRRWKRKPVNATASERQAALRWLAGLRAGGGTEMRAGVREALAPLRAGAQRQIVLITDGLVGFENEIVSTISGELPAGSRLHTVAVGSAPNRALTRPGARAGRGTEVVVDLDGDVGSAVARLLAATRAPMLTEVEVSGPAVMDHAPARLPDVLAGAPLCVAVRLRPAGGELLVRGKTADGAWQHRLLAPAVSAGTGDRALAALYAREMVEDLEMRAAAGLAEHDVDVTIERLGLEFQIATRLTSWVAIGEERTVDTTQPLRRERIPQALPHGMSAEGLGLRHGMAVPPMLLAQAVVSRGVRSAPGRSAIRASQHFILRSGEADASGDAASLVGLTIGSARTPVQGEHPDGSPLVVALVAWLARQTGHELHLEIDLDRPVAWAPTTVEVIWTDGSRRMATLIEGQTTRAGRYDAPQVLRLGLRFDAAAPSTEPPASLEVAGPGGMIAIAVLRR